MYELNLVKEILKEVKTNIIGEMCIEKGVEDNYKFYKKQEKMESKFY